VQLNSNCCVSLVEKHWITVYQRDNMECILFYFTESILYICDTTAYMLKNNHLYMSKTIF